MSHPQQQPIPPWPQRPGADKPRLPIVLLYHSIADARGDPWGVRVDPENFERHIAIIAAHCAPMRLTDVLDAVRTDSVPPRSVVVTFDDGYVDNLLLAKPILQRYGVPGTVFVSSGYIDQPREFWWDELDRLVLQAGWMSRRVCINIGGERCEWPIGFDGFQPWPLSRLRRRATNFYAYQTSPEDIAQHRPRQRMYRPLWERLRKARSVAERERAMAELRRQSMPLIPSRRANWCVTAAQLRELAEGDVIEIGAHTVDHPSLGCLSREDQRREVFESRRAIEAIIQRPVVSFAYPFGEEMDYNDDTFALLGEAGFRQACTNNVKRSPLTPEVHQYRIPRHIAKNLNAERFAAALAEMFQHYGGGERSSA